MASKVQHYVFGYGSLIERESRTRTTPHAEHAPPVIVRGVQRGWWSHGTDIGFSTCFLGAKILPSAECNGVIYRVSDEELAQLDERESMYDRVQVAPEHITLLDGRNQLDSDAVVWVYAARQTTQNTFQQPTPRFPIVQSYVDICLNGCLEVEAEYPQAKAIGYARKFVQTTQDWSRYWVNDRLYPRRPFIFVPRAFQIDRLLHEEVPQHFSQIQIEPARWEDA